jgi:hypothetical protein
MQQEWVAVFYKILCISETNYTTELKFSSICSKLSSLSYRYCDSETTLIIKIPQGFKVKILFLLFFLNDNFLCVTYQDYKYSVFFPHKL